MKQVTPGTVPGWHGQPVPRLFRQIHPFFCPFFLANLFVIFRCFWLTQIAKFTVCELCSVFLNSCSVAVITQKQFARRRCSCFCTRWITSHGYLERVACGKLRLLPGNCGAGWNRTQPETDWLLKPNQLLSRKSCCFWLYSIISRNLSTFLHQIQ